MGDIYKIVLSEKELFIVEKLKIKKEIIYNAKAILAVTQKKYYIKILPKHFYEFNCYYIIYLYSFFRYLEATICYLMAEHWFEAYDILTNHLLADYILEKGYIS